jgi:hypothetical protein
MDMHVLAGGDWRCSEANDLVVAPYRLACSDRAHGDFVPSRDPVTGCDTICNLRAWQKWRTRYYHMIVRVKANHRM